VPEALVDSSLVSISATEFQSLRDLIHRHTGIWLRDGKQVMLASRLARRLREHRMSSFSDYYHYVASRPGGGEELGELINCVTTNKTSFFREPHHFTFLSETILPEILARARQTGERPQVRIWSAASSTGPEPYSIAITLLEAQQRLRTLGASGWDAAVLASDIDTAVLGKAARGIYDEDETEGLEPELLHRYFLRGKSDMVGQVKVRKEVAALVTFDRINLMEQTWPVKGPLDAIFFRNALIYFRQETQDLFLRRMSRLLRPGGYLILGHSEHIPWLHELLEPLQKTIYRLRSAR